MCVCVCVCVCVEHNNFGARQVHVLESAYLITMYCCWSTDFETDFITLIYMYLN